MGVEGVALWLLSQPDPNAQSWQRPLMSEEVGHRVREVVPPDSPVELWGIPEGLEKKNLDPHPVFCSEAPHLGLSPVDSTS